MKNTIKMKSTKTETAIYRLLRLGVSMKGEEENHKNTWPVYLMLFQDVFRMLTELVPGVGRIPGTNVFLDLALASKFLNYQGNHSLHYN